MHLHLTLKLRCRRSVAQEAKDHVGRTAPSEKGWTEAAIIAKYGDLGRL